MQGKLCMVTGGTSGIGAVAAMELARMGAQVVVVGRDPEKTSAVVASISTESGNQTVSYLLADLSDQAQICRLAQEFRQRYERLDVLLNNAGGVFLRRQESVDGLEMTFALNHLGYFLLTSLLLDMLKDSAPSRIVNVSSNAHRGHHLDFDDVQFRHNYRFMTAYGRSKLANILFTRELALRLETSNVSANALHPGFVATNLGKNNGFIARLLVPLIQFRALTVEEGAQTNIYLASSPEVAGISGEYFACNKIARADPAAYDDTTARRLWEISEDLTGLK